MGNILHWIDFIWLPLGLYIVHKEQRIVAAAFFVSCFLMMRFQIEMLQSMGYPTGILPILEVPVRKTALIVYFVFYLFYLGISYWSPNTDKHIFLAASISIFFAAMFTSMVIMVL